MEERLFLIEKYKSIIQKWDKCNSQLKKLYPQQYESIKIKLQALQNGAEYTITQHTPENFDKEKKDAFTEMLNSITNGICGNQALDYTNKKFIRNTIKFKENKDIEYDVSKLVNFYLA
jgi:hypothetical protein